MPGHFPWLWIITPLTMAMDNMPGGTFEDFDADSTDLTYLPSGKLTACY